MRVGGAAFLLVCAASATASAQDPDGGNARGYFAGLEIRPAQVETAAPSRPNVIWIVVDALRPDHLGAYGYPKPTTPFLDEWAKDSLVFLHAYANAPWTRPSTATMLTGLLPSQHRTQTDESRLPPEIPTLGEELRSLGYETAAVVANGNGSSIAGLDRGFTYYADPATRFKRLPSAEKVYGEALRWLAERDKVKKSEKPFFLFVFVVDPHDPYHAPPEYEKEWLAGIGGLKGKPRRTAHWEYKNAYPAAERASMLALYDAAIRYTDDQTRRFFGELGKRGLVEKTAFVLTADHAEAFGEHGHYLHGHHHHDEIVRVPLLLKVPKWKGSGHVFHLVQHTDLFPTVLALAGGTPRAALPGKDIAAMLAAPPDPARRGVSEYAAFGIRRSAMFDSRWRAILQLPAVEKEYNRRIRRRDLLPSVSFDREVLHLYDRANDPKESKDLSAAIPEGAARPLVDALRAHMKAAHEPDRSGGGDTIPPSSLENLRSLGYVE